MKKSLFLSLLLSLLILEQAWGASVTCYVSPIGSNTSPYETWAKAATTPQTALAYAKGQTPTGTGAGQGHVVFISPGTYITTSAAYLTADSDYSGITITATASHGSTAPATEFDQIIFTPADGVHGIFIDGTVDNVTINGPMTIRVGGAGNALWLAPGTGTTDNNVINRVLFESTSSHSTNLVYLQNSSAILNRCIFGFYRGGTNYMVRQITNATTVFNYPIFTSSRYGGLSGAIRSQGGTITITNGIVLDSNQHGVETAGGTINIYNSIVQGGAATSDGCALYNASGTLNATNNLLLGGVAPTNYKGGDALDTDTDNILGDNPKFRNNFKRGFVIPRIDDYASLAFVQSMIPTMQQYNAKGIFAFSLNELLTSATKAADITAIQSLIQGGTWEIGLHGFSHSSVAYVHALNFSQTGGTGCTVANNGSMITMNCDGTDYDQTIDITNTSYDTLGEIITAYSGVKGWTIIKSTTDSQSEARITNPVKASSFATMGATSEPCDLDFDISAYNTGYFKDEIYAPVAAIKTELNPADTIIDGQTNANWEAKTFSYPFNHANASTRTATIAAGFASASGNIGNTGFTYNYDADTFSIWAISASVFKGTDEEETRQRTRSLAMLAANTGMIFAISGHTPNYDALTELTLAEWGYVLDELNKFQSVGDVTITSPQLVKTMLISAWTDDTDGTYSKTWGSYQYGYNLRPGSPAINAGDNGVWGWR